MIHFLLAVLAAIGCLSIGVVIYWVICQTRTRDSQ